MAYNTVSIHIFKSNKFFRDSFVTCIYQKSLEEEKNYNLLILRYGKI